MNLIITCGPSFEPIDEARRITNFSTGRLGVTLADEFTSAGWNVFCLKGESATYPKVPQAHHLESFSTNEDLAGKLRRLSETEKIDAVFHAAALCDFRVDHVLSEDGQRIASPKFSTREGHLHLVLAPAKKVLADLRSWFPNARIVGWKYELSGSTSDAFSRAWRQISETRIDACVLNGAAYGPGFALCTPPDAVAPCDDTPMLARALLNWLPKAARQPPAASM